MAPIFDTGISLFYNSEMIPSGQNLLEIAVSSFCKREVDMLRYVEHMDLFCMDLLEDFPQAATLPIPGRSQMAAEFLQGNLKL